MTAMRRHLLVCCLLSATACLGKSPATPTSLDGSVVLAAGQTVELTSDLSIGFVAVVGDSRCPINAGCIQAGDAIVRLALISNNTRGARDLHAAVTTPVRFEDLELRLVDLQPYPFAGRPTDPDDYRATVHV